MPQNLREWQVFEENWPYGGYLHFVRGTKEEALELLRQVRLHWFTDPKNPEFLDDEYKYLGPINLDLSIATLSKTHLFVIQHEVNGVIMIFSIGWEE